MAESLLASPWTSRESFLNQLGAGLGGQYNLYTAPKASRGYAGDFTISDLTPYQYTAQEFAGDNGMMDVERTGYKSALLDQLFGQGGWEIVSGGQSDGYNTPALMLRTRTMADPTSSTGHPGSWNGTVDPATGKLTGLQWINDDLSSGVIGNTFDKIGAAVTSPVGGPLAVLAAPYVFGSAFGAGAAGSGGATAADIAAAAGQPELGMVGQTGLTAGGAGGAAAGASGISLGAGAPISASPISSLGPAATWSDIGAALSQGAGTVNWTSLFTNPNAWLTGAQILGGLWGDNQLANAGEAQARAAAQAAASNAQIANRSLDLQKESFDFGKSLIEQYQPLYKRLIEADVGMAEDARDRSNAQWADYDQIFRPIEKRFAEDAMNYDSPTEIARREGLAAATAQGQIENMQQQRARTLTAQGVDPASGRSVIDDTNALAMAKSGAVNKERNDTVLQGMAMRQSAANFGRNMPNTSIAQNAAALQGNAAASNTAGAATAQPGVALQPALQFGNQAISANNSAGGLSLSGAGFDLSRSLNRTSSAGNVLGLGLGYLSDERAKEGFTAVDDDESLEDVRMTPVSEWDYKPGMGDGGHHVGAMAQDLQASMGSDVAPGGKMVDPISYMGKMHSAIRALDRKVSQALGSGDAEPSAMGLQPLRI